MSVYLRKHKPARSQFRSPRRARPTGCTILHTAESVMDAVGPDTGAENVAAFIARRSDPGSYHDLADSDSVIQLVEYGDEAFQDGTGSNPWALSISWALATTDWPKLSPARRDAFLVQGAVAFRRQQTWLRDSGLPMTPLRRITRAQSEAGVPGFISHGDRDPGRRSDPGEDFPWERWFAICADTAAGLFAPTDQEEPVISIGQSGPAVAIVQECLRAEALKQDPPRPYGNDLAVDGVFGRHMQLAVDQVQRAWGLPATGEVDGITAALLAIHAPTWA